MENLVSLLRLCGFLFLVEMEGMMSSFRCHLGFSDYLRIFIKDETVIAEIE